MLRRSPPKSRGSAKLFGLDRGAPPLTPTPPRYHVVSVLLWERAPAENATLWALMGHEFTAEILEAEIFALS